MNELFQRHIVLMPYTFYTWYRENERNFSKKWLSSHTHTITRSENLRFYDYCGLMNAYHLTLVSVGPYRSVGPEHLHRFASTAEQDADATFQCHRHTCQAIFPRKCLIIVKFD